METITNTSTLKLKSNRFESFHNIQLKFTSLSRRSFKPLNCPQNQKPIGKSLNILTMSSSYISETENQNGQFNGEEYEAGSFTPIKSEMEEDQHHYEAETVAEEEEDEDHCDLKRKPSDASVASDASDSSAILGPPKKVRRFNPILTFYSLQ